jgi:hypothetical protein
LIIWTRINKHGEIVICKEEKIGEWWGGGGQISGVRKGSNWLDGSSDWRMKGMIGWVEAVVGGQNPMVGGRQDPMNSDAELQDCVVRMNTPEISSLGLVSCSL